MESGRVTVNIRNCMICMLYLLANIDRFELPENVIILKQQWPLLKEAAESNEIIDFYNPKYWGGNRITERNTILCLTSFTTKLHQIVTSNKGTRVAWKISPTNHATQNSHIMTHYYTSNNHRTSLQDRPRVVWRRELSKFNVKSGLQLSWTRQPHLWSVRELPKIILGLKCVQLRRWGFNATKDQCKYKQCKKKAEKIRTNLDNMTFELRSLLATQRRESWQSSNHATDGGRSANVLDKKSNRSRSLSPSSHMQWWNQRNN